MLEVFDNFQFSILIVGWIAGKLSRKLTAKLDNWLDYGMILGFVRYRIAKYFAKRAGFDFEERERQITAVLEESDNPLQHRMDLYQEAYDLIAFEQFWFKPFVCIVCMSEYVNLVTSIGVGIYLGITDLHLLIVIIIGSITSRNEL